MFSVPAPLFLFSLGTNAAQSRPVDKGRAYGGRTRKAQYLNYDRGNASCHDHLTKHVKSLGPVPCWDKTSNYTEAVTSKELNTYLLLP
jgi:hypothetical protein